MSCIVTPPQKPFKYPGYFPLSVNNSIDIPTINGEEAIWLYWKLKSFGVTVLYEVNTSDGPVILTTSLNVTDDRPPHERTCIGEQQEVSFGALSLDFLNLPPIGGDLDILNFNDDIKSITTLSNTSINFVPGGLVEMCQKDGEAVMALRIFMPPLRNSDNLDSVMIPQIAIVPGGQADIVECQGPYGWPLGAVEVGNGPYSGQIVEVEFYNMSYWGDITCPEGYEEYCEEIAGV